MLDKLISSKTRVKLLLKFFLNSSISLHLRGLESEFGESSNAIRLELNKLEGAGLLTASKQGNKKVFQANTKHPMYGDIHSIVFKFMHLDTVVEQVVERLGNLDKVYLVGKLAQGLDSNDIDLIFVGDIDEVYLKDWITKIERKLYKNVRFDLYLPSTFDPEITESEHKNHLLLWSK